MIMKKKTNIDNQEDTNIQDNLEQFDNIYTSDFSGPVEITGYPEIKKLMKWVQVKNIILYFFILKKQKAMNLKNILSL